MAYKSYKDLDIYQLAHKLAVKVHKMTLKLPKFELYEEGSQLRRSSKSISSNIAEGFGRRRYRNEFIQFLTYALASCDETREHLDFIFETNSLKDKQVYQSFINEYEHLGKMLTKFIQAVEKGHLISKTRIQYQESRIKTR